jgi:preprotein translocase subunit SecE
MADTTRTTTSDFVSEVRDEIHKVTWPDRDQLKESTGVIVVFVLLVSALIFVIDYVVRIGLEGITSLFGA